MKNQKIPAVLGLLPLLGLTGCGMFSGSERTPEVTHATRLNVAMAAEASGDSQTALQLYAGAVAKNPSDTNAVVLYARALVNARRISLARELLVRQLDAQPGQPALARELATIDVLQGQPAAALPRFDLALARDKNDVRALVNKGIALDMLGNHVEAQELYQRADRLSPDDSAIRSNLAMSLMLAGRAADASRMMDTVAEGPVAVPRIRNNMAVLAASSGDMPRARQLSNGEISDAELRALAEQIRQREQIAPVAPPPVASAPAPVTTPVATAPAAASVAATMAPVAAEPVLQPASAPIPLAVPDNSRRPTGEKMTPARGEPAKPAPVDRRNMTAIDRQVVAMIERAAERDMVESVFAPTKAPTRMAGQSSGQSSGQSTGQQVIEAPAVIPAMASSRLRVRLASMVPEDTNLASVPALRAAPGPRLGYGVQLGALDSEPMAKWAWRRLSGLMPTQLQGRNGQIVPMVRNSDGRSFWRIVTTGFQNRAEATELCSEIKTMGTDCFVTKL